MDVARVQKLLVDGGVLSAEDVDERIAAWEAGTGPSDDGSEFVEQLVASDILTDFQKAALLAGVSPPYMVGPYLLHDRIAIGLLGNIYRAVHEEFDQPVSLKIFPASLQQDPQRELRLARETRIAVQVQHRNVLRTYQVGKIGDFVFVAFEDLKGETLQERLDKEGRLPLLESCRIARHVAEGLAYLHEQDIVHRDVQPKNIWLNNDGRVLLTEFSAACDALTHLDAADGDANGDGDTEESYVVDAETLGNSDYLSAEHCLDEELADACSDLYSLGCVFYRCLTGQPVFPDADPVRKMLRHALQEPNTATEIDSEIPHTASEVISMLLAKEPGDRYQKAEDVVLAVESLMSADVEQAVAVADVSPEFLEWAATSSELTEEENIPTVVSQPEFFDFLEFITEEEEDIS